MESILLKFAGPLQSFGSTSHFETRQTDKYPTKSAVIGMIAASLGLSRDDKSRLNALNDLDFAVRIDQPGRVIRDYHIAEKKKKNGQIERTYVTNRFYIEDAVFVVGIANENAQLMDEIFQALQRPYFQQSLGRKALVPTSDMLIGKYDTGVMDALSVLPWQAAEWYQVKKQVATIPLTIHCDSYLVDEKPRNTRKDVALSFSKDKREFTFRSESKVMIEVENPSSEWVEHDVFSFLGGE